MTDDQTDAEQAERAQFLERQAKQDRQLLLHNEATAQRERAAMKARADRGEPEPAPAPPVIGPTDPAPYVDYEAMAARNAADAAERAARERAKSAADFQAAQQHADAERAVFDAIAAEQKCAERGPTEIDQVRAEVAQLRADVERLQAQLAERG